MKEKKRLHFICKHLLKRRRSRKNAATHRHQHQMSKLCWSNAINCTQERTNIKDLSMFINLYKFFFLRRCYCCSMLVWQCVSVAWDCVYECINVWFSTWKYVAKYMNKLVDTERERVRASTNSHVHKFYMLTVVSSLSHFPHFFLSSLNLLLFQVLFFRLKSLYNGWVNNGNVDVKQYDRGEKAIHGSAAQILPQRLNEITKYFSLFVSLARLLTRFFHLRWKRRTKKCGKRAKRK